MPEGAASKSKVPPTQTGPLFVAATLNVFTTTFKVVDAVHPEPDAALTLTVYVPPSAAGTPLNIWF